jgi:hypothetical protein
VRPVGDAMHARGKLQLHRVANVGELAILCARVRVR